MFRKKSRDNYITPGKDENISYPTNVTLPKVDNGENVIIGGILKRNTRKKPQAQSNAYKNNEPIDSCRKNRCTQTDIEK